MLERIDRPAAVYDDSPPTIQVASYLRWSGWLTQPGGTSTDRARLTKRPTAAVVARMGHHCRVYGTT
jgi:hypothetical protein